MYCNFRFSFNYQIELSKKKKVGRPKKWQKNLTDVGEKIAATNRYILFNWFLVGHSFESKFAF